MSASLNLAGIGFVAIFLATIFAGGWALRLKRKYLAMAVPWFLFFPLVFLIDSTSGGAGISMIAIFVISMLLSLWFWLESRRTG